MYRKILSLVTVAMMGGIMVLASGQSAEAKTCTYIGTTQYADTLHGGVSTLHGTRIKTVGNGVIKDLACKRARERCKKKIKKLSKQFHGDRARGGICKKL